MYYNILWKIGNLFYCIGGIELRRNRKHQREGIKTSRTRTTRSKTTKKRNGSFKKVVNFLFACLFVFLIACIGIGAGMYAAIVQEIEDMNIQELALARSSIVYYTDENGNSIEEEFLSNDGNCIWVESSEISEVMKEAIVAIEDERFYRHGGVDIKRTAGAVIGYIREKLGGSYASYGGSTITQQVIKNITSEKDRTATRKIKEMMRAVALEKQLSKDEILTVYLNVIFLSNNCYGVEAASNRYFAKSASELNLTEAALIAGITQRPSYYNPLKNPENALTKRNTVLLKMYETEKITKEEYEEAIASDLGIHESQFADQNNVYSYFVDTVINEVIADLQAEKGYTEAFATQQVFGGGLKIYTTMDYKIQSAMEEVFENSSNFPGGAAKAQAAMIIIDPNNGEIKGVIGGKGKKTSSRGLNYATQTRRQPGSSMKPLSVYAPAIDKKELTPSTILVDEPITIKDWSPRNSYSGFKGSMTVKKAIEISANIPAIKALQKVGINTSYSYVKDKFQIEVADADRDLSPLALGGLTNGVTVKEMAAAYQAFANGGYYYTPHTYTKVLDSSNRVLLEKKVEKTQAIGKDTSYIMSQMLYGVVNSSSGTGKRAKLDSSMAVYGKTGTTNNDYDKWFVGYTPYYVGSVWFGFEQQKSIRSVGVTTNISAQLWKKVMEKVHEGLEPASIDMPDDMVKSYVCTISGLLASSSCPSSSEYFLTGTQPKKYCGANHNEAEEEEDLSEEGAQIPEGTEGEDITNSTEQTPQEETIPPQEETIPPQEQTPPQEVTPIEPETSRPPVEENPDDDVISLE